MWGTWAQPFVWHHCGSGCRTRMWCMERVDLGWIRRRCLWNTRGPPFCVPGSHVRVKMESGAVEFGLEQSVRARVTRHPGATTAQPDPQRDPGGVSCTCTSISSFWRLLILSPLISTLPVPVLSQCHSRGQCNGPGELFLFPAIFSAHRCR